MKRFTVIITRDVTESYVAEVEATDPAAAEEAAWAHLADDETAEWRIDEGSWNTNPSYVTDITEED